MQKRVAITFSSSDRVLAYEDAARISNLEPVRSSPQKPVSLDQVDALLLSGGTDVNPALYQETPDPATEAPEDNRDQMELLLLREAIARDMPVLAICRGFQLLNVALGGSLIQDIPRHVKRPRIKGTPAHQVEIVPGSKLAQIAGTEPMAVNSRHHQAVKRLGRDLRVSARSVGDQVIEAAELDGAHFVMGVQWHPENQAREDARQRKLFDALATAIERGSARC